MSDDWGGQGGAAASSAQVPRTEKYDLEPYDDDDYEENMGPKKSQVSCNVLAKYPDFATSQHE